MPKPPPPDNDVINRLFATITARKTADPQESYVASLYAGGRQRILAKIEEEAEEVVEAAFENDNKQIIYESADLLFHLLVLWADAGISVDDVLGELKRREGTSGHAEKASR